VEQSVARCPLNKGGMGNNILASPRIVNKVVNLHTFFYLLVMVPAWRRFVLPLLSLPHNFFFTVVHRSLYFWGYATRTKGNLAQVIGDMRMMMKYR
jgi:hypothetical protein